MLPMPVTFRSTSKSTRAQALVNKYLKKIKRIHHKISYCRVVVDATAKNSDKGKVFTVSVDLNLAGKELATKKHNQNLALAIRDAFLALEKVLEKYQRRKMDMLTQKTFFNWNDNLETVENLAWT